MRTILSLRRHHYLKRFGIFLIMVALVAGIAGCGAPADNGLPMAAEAATPEDIEASIEKGLEYLVAQQNLTAGQFMGEYGELAETSFAVLKLLDRAYETGKDPFQEDSGAPDYYMYHDNVVSGLDYIFLQAGTYGPGTGITFQMWGHETYNTGIAMMAIAASQTPDRVVVSANPVVNGLTYQQVAQGCVDYFVMAQNPDGAWRYWFNPEPSDQSNTGYATLGLSYAEEFGCTVPQALKDNLNPWLDAIQDDVNGDTDDGGSHYTVGGGWVNLLKTGHLLFEFAFVGDTVGVGRVDDAVDYIERHWNDPNPDPGWQNHYQAMYCLMKGFEAQGIEEIEVGGSPVDWFDEIADQILATQNTDGSWPWDYWGGPLLATEWALLTLEKVAPLPVIRVSVDIKPMSWPNPLNVKSKGVLPVAILGTADFDVSQVDPATVRLEGVAPLRWALEDVGTTSDPLAGPDGFADLSLKFDTQEIVAALGAVKDGDNVVLHLSGNLKAEFDGTPISGQDVVRIIKKIPWKKDIPTELVIGTARDTNEWLAVFEQIVAGPVMREFVEQVNLAGGVHLSAYDTATEECWVPLVIDRREVNLGEAGHLEAVTQDICDDIAAGDVHFLWGGPGNDFVLAQAPIADDAGVVLLTLEGGAAYIRNDLDKLPSWPYVFIPLSYSDWYQLPVLADMLEAELGRTPKAYVVHIEGEHGDDYLAVAESFFDVVDDVEVPFDPGSMDADAVVNDAMTALGTPSSPNYDIFCGFVYPDHVWAITNSAMALGFNPPAMVFGPGANYGIYSLTYGNLVDGILSFTVAAYDTNAEIQDVYDLIAERMDDDAGDPLSGLPGVPGSLSLDYWGIPCYWAGLQMWLAAVEEVGYVDQDELKNVLASKNAGNPFETILGDTWYTMSGGGGGNLDYLCHTGEIGQWQSGVFETVGPVDAGQPVPGLPSYVVTANFAFPMTDLWNWLP